MRAILSIIFFFLTIMNYGQQKITFKSGDGIIVTADLYLKDKSYPYIILFHQANYSRGEYIETAPKLMKLGFNCLAVDLRSGKEVNFVQNETAIQARLKGLPTEYLDAEKDMIAAITYIKQISPVKIILFGSSYSASLCLKIATSNTNIISVVAFSPGEYFQSSLRIKDEIKGLTKPLFIASTKAENPFIKEMVNSLPVNQITWYMPSKSNGMHGSRALWQKTPENEDCWMALLLFLKNFKK